MYRHRETIVESEEIILSYALKAVIAVAICRTNASNDA